MRGRSWHGGDNDLPRFGRGARQWFRHALRYWLEVGLCDMAAPMAFRLERLGVSEQVVDWFAENPEAFVKWLPTKTYSGPRWNSGGWTLDVLKIFPALHGVLRGIDAGRYTTLDDWLRADSADDLLYDGHDGGTSLLPPAMFERTVDAAAQRAERAKKNEPGNGGESAQGAAQ